MNLLKSVSCISILALALALPGCSGSNIQDTGIIHTSSGDLKGTTNPATGISVFKGIPYAAPPLGDKRWAPPSPPIPWTGIRQANRHGPACMQDVEGEGQFIDMMMDGVGMADWQRWTLGVMMKFMPAIQVSEDCLTLSVYAPADQAEPLPVMVWYHGGAHKFGAGDTDQYDGSLLARHGVIVVTINYRLGVMGFMAHPQLTAASPHQSSGNYGTLDQLQALHWVQENIGAFGGDPGNVTIFGESAGGHSVGQLMASPLSKGLVHRAIAQSGTGTYQLATLADGERGGETLAKLLVPDADNPLDVLRDLPAAQIHQMFSSHPELDVLSHPVVDGWVLPRSTAGIFTAGKQAPIPLMVGSNADEGTLLGPLLGTPFYNRWPGPTSADAYRDLVRDEYKQEGERLLELYPVASDADLHDAINTLMGDHMFGMQAWFTALKHQQAGYPTYLYFLTRTSPSPTQWAGAFHAADIQFVFGTNFPFFPENDYDAALTEQVMSYWTQFARTGDPNGAGLPHWSAFDPANPREMELGQQVGMRPVERRENYQLLVTMMARYLQHQEGGAVAD